MSISFIMLSLNIDGGDDTGRAWMGVDSSSQQPVLCSRSLSRGLTPLVRLFWGDGERCPLVLGLWLTRHSGWSHNICGGLSCILCGAREGTTYVLNTNEDNYLNIADTYKLIMTVTMETGEWRVSKQGNS